MALEKNKIYCADCLDLMKEMEDNSVDLVLTDPPYLIESTKAGGKSQLARSIQGMNDELENGMFTEGINTKHLDEIVRVCKNINVYLWCNHKQIPQYFDYFLKKHNCNFDIIIWNKINATPLFNNKYITDKEYCLYFRKCAYCNPKNYENAKTVYHQPINIVDKNRYSHHTIKPLNIIKTLVCNSSKEGQTIFDPFLGSGTTAVACINTGRNFIGIEKDEDYFEIAQRRIKDAQEQERIDQWF
jgi:site-specific DNA-methyltransferase (adenine-specific)